MIHTICWNARSINTKGALERLQQLKAVHNVSTIAILEPFIDNSHINIYKSRLRMENAYCNLNGKIWIFWNQDVDCKVLDSDDQQVTCEFSHAELPFAFTTTFVYAKCSAHLRRPLWDKLLHHAAYQGPWCTVGDFNVITTTTEKKGGVPYNINKSFDFLSVIEACGLIDLGFHGQQFTWCNQRNPDARVWKRLDRAMVNDKWLEIMPHTSITHLPSVGSDHCPLLMEVQEIPHSNIRYFKFLHCWTDNQTFLDTVRECWNGDTTGNPMWTFHAKMKRLAATLSKWSRNQYGDIHARVKQYEGEVSRAEEEMLNHNNAENRANLHAVNAEYIRYLKLEESILKQKTQLQWFKEGDTNSKYFHALIRGRRRRLFIHKISNEHGEWIQGEENIANAACAHFKDILAAESQTVNEAALDCIPTMITDAQNQVLSAMPSIDELKQVVFSMNPNSAAGPDGMNGKFFQSCWDIIKRDLLAVVQSFFCGHPIPKYFSHSCLVLIPKVDHPSRFSEFRPISLSNFTSKIISKLLCLRLAPILPDLISENQSGFVKGRSISENIMLAQEITHSIKKPKPGDNVVIKLDMAKAYDRVSWSFICLVLRKMGFAEFFIDMVWRIMSNNWYSIIINGARHGFFRSSRGLKQGDPLSPALFILGAEVLSRMLNNLQQNQQYKGFHMEFRGPQINHLSFADDVIIFASGTTVSLQLIMQILSTYESVSGQQINREKSHYMIPHSTPPEIIATIRDTTGFNQKESPITYLGCPLYIGRQRVSYFFDMIDKVVRKISGWQSRILSFGGRVTLVRHVLQSLPIHTLAAISPPKTILNYIKKLTADFFWGWDKDKKKYHWASWETLGYPLEEGGIGVRQISDVCKAFQLKQWWTFRAKKTLWGDFLRAKYCQRANPVAKKWDTGQSLVWKHMMTNKGLAENYISWKLRSGSCCFWWDDWLGIGALAQHRIVGTRPGSTKVSQFLIDGRWNEEMIRQHVSPLLVPQILSTQFHFQEGVADTPIWKPNESGTFTCSSAWELVRAKKEKTRLNTNIWHKSIPFKISFLLWRALRGKLPTNDRITQFGSTLVDCFCCNRTAPETIDHVLVSGHFARHIWQFFAGHLGSNYAAAPLHFFLLKWWATEHKNDAHKLLIHATPIFICWNLWKNRCASKYGGKKSNSARVKFLVFKDIYFLLAASFPHISWPTSWNDLVSIVEKCSHDVKVTSITWKKPAADFYKLNTDGSALQNPGSIGGGGILRDHHGNLIYAFSTPFGIGTNNQAEVKAAIFGVTWCIQHGYTKLILEVDSALLIQWITHHIHPPWRLDTDILELQKLVSQLESFQSRHVYREANYTADALSKCSHHYDITQQYYTHQQLPRAAKGYFILDKLGTMSFRRRKLKRIKKPP